MVVWEIMEDLDAAREVDASQICNECLFLANYFSLVVRMIVCVYIYRSE
jgi:hypothetical protein